LGILLAMGLTLRSRSCPCAKCARANRATFWQDCLFAFLASLPRGTLQGCLGAEPTLMRLLMASGGVSDAGALIQAAARLYILGLSSIGHLLLDCLGPRLLRSGAATLSTDGAESPTSLGRCASSLLDEERCAAAGWTARRGGEGQSVPLGNTLRLGLISEDGVVFEDTDAPAFPLREAVNTLAKLYHVEPEVFLDAFQEQGGEGLGSVEELRPATYTRLAAQSMEAAALPGQTSIRRAVRPRTLPSSALFELVQSNWEPSDEAAAAPGEAPRAAGAQAHSKAVRL